MAGGRGGGLFQEEDVPKAMWLLILEALLALALLLLFVWWTMFSGRRRDEGDGENADGGKDEAGRDEPPR